MATPDVPLDFLGRRILEGDYIVYPTGGTSARMVLARVKRIEEPATLVRNGLIGLSRFRLVVNRIKEGNRTTGEGWWAIDESREVRVDQLHRVVVVPVPASLEAQNRPTTP